MSNKKLTVARRAATVTMQMASMPIPAPEGWAERYAVYGGTQEGWACDADGVTCVPWDIPVPAFDAEHFVFDPVRQASPPRVIVVE